MDDILNSRVVAVVATYRRDECLRRLMAALGQQSLAIHALVVADNAASQVTRELVTEHASFLTEYIELPDNPGCGAGLAAAIKNAQDLWGEELTFCIFDDDAVPEADAVEMMSQGMQDEGAWAAAPMLIRRNNIRDDGPEVIPASLHRQLVQVSSPNEVLKILEGTHPEFVWCKGPAMMVSAAAVRQCGRHRSDMWMLGEDIEYSMRLSHAGRCVFIPEATVHHLPPTAGKAGDDQQRHQVKFLAMLQNLAFMGVHLSHTRRCLRYLPSHVLRFCLTFRSGRSLLFGCQALWNGLFCGEPAGGTRGRRLREKVIS